MTRDTHEPLPRQHRPRRFEGPDGLIGQPHVSRTLKNALASDRLAHAYLFAGPRGTGKTTAARLLAAALNCTEPDGVEPCGRCERCKKILAGRESQDVIEIDAASHRGVEDARRLREQAQYAPSRESAHKVYILDEAHMMTRAAWNALLKVIEEPPSRVLFAFCTTEPEKIEQTARPILSRCQRLDMRRLTVADIAGHLERVAEAAGIEADDGALVMLARRADGAMRDALSALDQMRAFGGDGRVTPEVVREAFGLQPERTYLRTLEVLASGERDRVFRLVRYLSAQGVDLAAFLEAHQDTLGDLAWAMEGGEPDGWSEEGRAALLNRAGRGEEEPLLTTSQAVRLMAVAEEGSRRMRRARRPDAALLITLQRSIDVLEDEDG